MAQQYLRENADQLKISRDLNDLRYRSMRETPGGYHVRFQQYAAQYPVYQGEIVVNIDRNHTVTFVMNSYKPPVQFTETAAAVSLSEADELPGSIFRYREVLNYQHQESVVYYHKGRTRLAHKITLVPAEDRFGDWEVMVDAMSGEIFRVVDKACYHGRGRVFDPDPLTRARAIYQAGGQFGDNNDNDTDSLVAQIVWRDLPDISFYSNQYHLEGPYANIEDFEAPFKGLFSRPDTVWNFTRSPDAFEAANVYFHLDKSMRYINETLGFNLMPFQYTGGVQFDPHGLNGDDNSHYIPSTGRVAWGEGGRGRFGRPDVILHELGHGIHDWVTNGSLSQVTGLSEGCGDYWAVSYNRSLGFWTPSNPQYNWVFQWDGHNEFWPGRITSYAATYPGGLVGQIHTDGQIWASTLMQIYDDIGRRATDENFLEALSMLNSSSNQEDAAQAFVQADVNLHGGANLAAIEYWFTLRGYNVVVPQIGPLSPANLTAYSNYATPTAIHLTWEDPTRLANGDTLLSGDFHVFIERDGSGVDSVAGGVEEYTDSGLNDGQEYFYEIYARLDSLGIRSPIVQASWIAGGSPVPTPPLQVAIGSQGNQVTLSWINNTENIDGTAMDDLAGINIYRNGNLFNSLTRSTADTGRADSVIFANPGRGFQQWWLTTLDNESPVNESEPSQVVITPLNSPLGDIFTASGVPDSAIWFNDDADVNERALNAPSGLYALNLNGKPDGGDLVEIYPVDLRDQAGSGMVFAYSYQPQGQGNVPEPGDSLLVYFMNDAGSWVLVRGYPGRAVQPFQQEVIDLASAPGGGGSYFHSQFQVRFRSIGSVSMITPNDDWFVDNVFLGAPAPLISASQDTLFFGVTFVDSTSTLEMSVYNLGLDSLAVSEILSPGSEFGADPGSFSLAAGGTQLLTVSFTPAQAGLRTGALRMVSNDPSQDTLTIHVQGIGEAITGLDELAGLPRQYRVSRNYPNPFNPVTVIQYDLPYPSAVSLVVYNLLGQQVRSLVGQQQPAGRYSVAWDGRNDAGDAVASGIYLYRFEAGPYRKMQKMILVK